MKNFTTIAFSGAPLTGKTTLSLSVAGRLRQNGIEAAVVPEAVRGSHYFASGKMCNALNMEVLSLQILAEARERNHNQFLVLDRCVYDLIAYFRLREARNDPWPIDRSSIEQFLYAHSKSYDLVFLCTHPQQLEKDPFREKETLGEQEIANEIEAVLKGSRREYLTVPDQKPLEFVIRTLIDRDIIPVRCQ
ncbi:AAA family ATPase [Bradyrhizobium sp. HKCCYLS3013]|uniref:AAA family ATPase n=1 Tax=Bradyrhizobium sp. HKCCYLS3013 TaxID=3420735 RepID=UPI003EBC3D13